MPTFASVRPLPALVLCALLLCALTLPVRAATLYVSPVGSDDNSGAIGSPYKTIRAAVNNASSGDTIALAYAIYQGNGNRDIDFAGKSLSVVSQSGPGKAIIDCQGTQHEPHRAFYFHSKESDVLLDGLTIKNSTDSGAINIIGNCVVKLNKCGFRDNSGDCIINDGKATLTDCLFLSNPSRVMINGGNSTASLTNCVFQGNTNSRLDNDGMATLTACMFMDNHGTGGIFNEVSGTLILTDCMFSGNTSGGNGGGVFNGGTASLTACVFRGNSCERGGGGGFANDRTATLTACTFSGNSCHDWYGGGGVYNGGSVMLSNCILSANVSTNSNGGGISNAGHSIIRFCSFAANAAKGIINGGTVAQGGAVENDGTALLTDDVLWGNTAPNAAEIGTPVNGNQTTTATYCDIQGGLSGTGNIKANPLFVSTANPIMPPIAVTNVGDVDLHLQAGSPCLGAGITIPPTKADPRQYKSKSDPSVLTDADGQKRPNPPSIGAYEYSANPPKPKKVLTLDVGTANAAGDAALVADAAAVPGAASQAPGIQPAQEHPALAVPPVGPQPRLDPQQENAAFLQLMVALNTGHYAPSDMAQRIQTELDRGADINVKDGEGFPAIVTAASLSHADVVQVLLEKGADASRATEQVGKSGAADSNSILHKTANGYQVDIGNAISGLFAKKPKPLYGQTALMFAAQSGQAETVTLLLAHHADSHAKDSRGKSALDYATQNHRDDIAQVLKAQEAR